VRYITNDRNQLSALGISATNTVASRDYVRTDTTAKAGGGVVSLSGDYTGTSDIVLDVEIVDDGGTTRRVSAPEFSGVGNGVMSDLSAAGTVDAQTSSSHSKTWAPKPDSRGCRFSRPRWWQWCRAMRATTSA